jgi:hypothetical protein
MANKKPTSTRVATLAARTLADPHKSKTSKKLAGSALAKANSKRRK